MTHAQQWMTNANGTLWHLLKFLSHNVESGFFLFLILKVLCVYITVSDFMFLTDSCVCKHVFLHLNLFFCPFSLVFFFCLFILSTLICLVFIYLILFCYYSLDACFLMRYKKCGGARWNRRNWKDSGEQKL